MKLLFTDQGLRGLAAPPGRYVEHWDGGFKVPGVSLGIRVSGTTGSKSWTVVYRKDGRPKRVTLGSYPSLGLADARKRAHKLAASIVATGFDPVAERKERQGAPTFREVAERFLRQYPAEAGLRASTRADYTRVLHNELIPRWGDRKAAEIARADVIALLDEIAIEREAPIQSNRTRAAISKIFNWALGRDLVSASPCAGLPRRRKETKRARVLTDAEIGRLWRALDDERPIMAALFRFLLLTAQRSGEVREARWSEIEGEVWTVPANRAKNGEAHAVPLSERALAVLDTLRPLTGASEYVFASSRQRGRGGRPASRRREEGPILWLSHAAARIAERANLEDFRPHDLRRTAATTMGRLGVDRETVAKILNHKDGSITSIYDRYQRWPERVAALSKWGAHVEAVVKGAPRLEMRLEGRKESVA